MLFDKHGQLIHQSTTQGVHDDLMGDKGGASGGDDQGNGGGPQIVDEALADIVLVRKQEMEEWRRK